MSDGTISLDPADFANHTAVEITHLKVDPEAIEYLAFESAKFGGVGLVLLSSGGNVWTPTARDLRPDQPAQPQGFDRFVEYGSRSSIAGVIRRWRDLDSEVWRHRPPTKTRMLLVFDSASDAETFLTSLPKADGEEEE